jgi:DNA-3-methyladenine glycosylase
METNGSRTSGFIVETEAYIGTKDLGCHASAGRTERNAVMWGSAGHAYVYFTYGMHWMLNFVTEQAGFPAAVLLRAVLPHEGEQRMRRRRMAWRKRRSVSPTLDPKRLTDGPAKLAQAFKLDGDWNGHDLCNPESRLFIEMQSAVERVTTGPRVGLNTVPEPWKSIGWRLRVPREDYRSLRGGEEIQ